MACFKIRRLNCVPLLIAIPLLVLNFVFMWQQGNLKGQRTHCEELEGENNQLKLVNKRMKETLRNMQNRLSTEAANTQETTRLTLSLPRPKNDENTVSLKVFIDSVTIILYDESITTPKLNCQKLNKNALEDLLPGVKILSSEEKQTVASTFNSLSPLVKTKYFLFLDSEYKLADYNSDHSVKWLLHALINIPELDFVSGAVLKGNYLEVPCYRFSLCNWTLSQRYEYKRSVGELMICENIASSFMGKTASIRALFGSQAAPFDVNLTALSTTDFFLRAKQKGAVVGVRPEVYFTLSNKCHTRYTLGKSHEKMYKSLVPFAEKHQIYRFKDSDSNVIDICGKDSPLLGEGICNEETAHKVMLNKNHWAYSGIFAYPFVIENLQEGIVSVVDFLDSRNITYFIDGGVPLGALKMRAILPWDAGDVDFGVYIEGLEKLLTLMESFALPRNYTVRKLEDQVQVFVAPGKVGMKMAGLMSMFPVTGPVPDNKEFIKIKTNGKWIQYKKGVFAQFRKYYGINYLQHRMYASNDVIHCTQEGHNACLPDFRSADGLKGTAGTYREYFCSV